MLQSTLCRLSSGMNTCKITSTQIEFVSGGDPPMPKSERKVGEQELNVNSSRVLVSSWLTSPIFLTPFIDKIFVIVGRSLIFYGAKSLDHNHIVDR